MAPVDRSPAPLRVLVVDDIVDTAESMGELLELWGYQVAVAFEGVQALNLARQFRPQVALLDIGLPGMNGYEIARRLRQELDTHGTFLIALTGYGSEQDRQLAREASFNLHFTKPVDVTVLHDVLETTARQSSNAT